MHTSGTAHAAGSGTDEHPSLETLAAFLDGKLPDAERKRVMKHLAACKACFSLFADTARTLRDLEPAGGKVLRFPFLHSPGVRHTLPFAVAAVLVLGVGLTAYVWLWRPPDIVVAELVEPLPGKPQLSNQIWKVAFRSASPEPEPPPAAAESFQLGARLVDFQLSVEAENSEQAADAARRIALLLEGNVLGYPAEGPLFRRVETSLEEQQARPRQYRGLVADVTPALDEGFIRPWSDFGKWTAAGRFYALAKHPAFFERRANRRFLKLLLEHPTRLDPEREPVEIEGEVQERLREVAAIWDAGRLDEAAYRKLAGLLEWILRHYEEMSADYDL